MIKDGLPMPKPSKAPHEMTETAETINPILMIRRAALPAMMVSVLVENKPISCPGISQHNTVPAVIMQAERTRAIR